MAQQYSWPSSSNVTLTGSTNGAPIPSTSVVVGGEDPSGNVQPFEFDASGNLLTSTASSVLPTGAATEAKQDDQITELQSANTSLDNIETSTGNIDTSTANIDTTLTDRLAGSLVPEAYDYIALTYVAAGNGVGQVETATYKLGGAGGTTVKTLTMTYDGSDRLATTTAS